MNSIPGKFHEAARHMIDSMIARLPALIVALAVFLLMYGLSIVISRTIRRATPRHRQNFGIVVARLTGALILFVGLLVAFSIIAPSFQAADLIKILGIGGVAIGFAFQNILQNFLAGLLLLWSEPFRTGDEIKLDNYEGTVEQIQARATIIKTYDQREIVIPNADLFTRSVIVNTALDSRRWEYDVSVGRTPNLSELKSRIVSAVRAVSDVLPDPSPEALVVGLDPPNSEMVKIRVLWWTKAPRQHQMLYSYDKVLSAIAAALVDLEGRVKEGRAA
jgi:small conductance mechanosensitive channel